MKKNTLLLAVLLSIILFTSILANPKDNTATANPMTQRRFDASPIITIQSPANNTAYSPDNAILVFNLTRPNTVYRGPYDDGWFEPIKGSISGDDFGNKVVNATYYIDGQPSNISIEVNSHLLEPFNYSLPLSGLTDENHTLQIYLFCNGVEGMTWAAGFDMGYVDYYAYSEVVSFTVDSSDTTAFITIPLSGVTIALVAFLVAATGLGAGLLYCRHRKKLLT